MESFDEVAIQSGKFLNIETHIEIMYSICTFYIKNFMFTKAERREKIK